MNNTSHEINNISNYQIVSRKGRTANLSLLSILIVCFICMISFSVRNFISNRMTLDIYAGDLASIEDEELLAEIHVKKGDNLKKILIEQKISNSDVALIIKSLKNANINIVLKPGDIVSCD
ncbi:MAG: hypothetical protein EB127_12385, partial [Alphaproteobacteria bacterium]|nr:hypothetical protein [Alphaproteobacteria bacterium]